MKLEEVILEPDTRANQPAASSVPTGTLYCVSDEGDIVERSNGTTWDTYSPGAGSSIVSDTAYDATIWNGVTTVAPSKNAVRDKIETLISDTAYSSGWNGVTDAAPSKNAVYDQIESSKILGIEVVIDGGGATITTGIKVDIEIPFACTINRVTLLADQSGSIVIDIWKDTYANYPPTDADSITASAPPTISTATKSQDSTLTGWTTSVSAGDTLRFNVDSVTTIQRVTLSLKVTKT